MADSTRQAIPRIEGQRGLDAIDPTERLQELKQELLEVMAQASLVDDQASVARCRWILHMLRTATLNYDTILADLYERTVAVYGSRPEVYTEMLHNRADEWRRMGTCSVEVGQLIPLPTQKRTG